MAELSIAMVLMNKIDELIKKYCPNGVEFKTLGEVCTIDGGKLNANKATSTGKYKFFTYDYTTPKFIDEYEWDCECLIVCKKEREDCCRYFNGKFNAFQWMRILKDFNKNVDIRFTYYYLNTYFKTSKEVQMPYIPIDNLRNYNIPIPPIEVQKEIVQILDKFTELEAELEAELEVRKKQYEYYRNSLLSFEGKAEQDKIGQHGRLGGGGTKQIDK